MSYFGFEVMSSAFEPADTFGDGVFGFGRFDQRAFRCDGDGAYMDETDEVDGAAIVVVLPWDSAQPSSLLYRIA